MSTDAPPAERSGVADAFGPTLEQLLGRRRARVLYLGVLGLAVLGLAGYLLTHGEDARRFVRTAPPAFNLRHSPVLREAPPGPGVILDLQGRRKGLFTQSMTVRRLRLPAYRGAVSAALPAFATRYRLMLARRFEAFAALDEGKVRINGNPGYAIAFRAKRGERTLWGREVLLLPNGQDGVRDGLAITLLQTAAAGAHSTADVASVGALKKPYRSLRFGSATGGNQ